MSRQLPAERLGLQRLRRFARLAQRASLRYAPLCALRGTAFTNHAVTVQGMCGLRTVRPVTIAPALR
jgi:hypothetical protein